MAQMTTKTLESRIAGAQYEIETIQAVIGVLDKFPTSREGHWAWTVRQTGEERLPKLERDVAAARDRSERRGGVDNER